LHGFLTPNSCTHHVQAAAQHKSEWMTIADNATEGMFTAGPLTNGENYVFNVAVRHNATNQKAVYTATTVNFITTTYQVWM
jgi:hypothetical protein